MYEINQVKCETVSHTDNPGSAGFYTAVNRVNPGQSYTFTVECEITDHGTCPGSTHSVTPSSPCASKCE